MASIVLGASYFSVLGPEHPATTLILRSLARLVTLSACDTGSGEIRQAKRFCRGWHVELEPRAFLGCNNEARRRGISMKDLVNSILMMWLEREAEVCVEERMAKEAREWAAEAKARSKNWHERKSIRQLKAIRAKFRQIAELQMG